MKSWRSVSAGVATFILGALFLFSGTVKLMDPVGAGLVVGEYLSFFHLGFLKFAANPMGVGVALLESMVGVALLCGVWRKVVWAVTGAMMAFFTVLTLILLVFNPSMDCGCFGEAVHLTHLQSFLKNVVILGLWSLTFKDPGLSGVFPLPEKWRYVIFGVDALAVLVFALLSTGRLPLVDYTDMAPGVELFSYDNPDGPILSMLGEDDEYVDEIEGRAMVLSSYSKLSPRQSDRIERFGKDAAEMGIEVYRVASYPSFGYMGDRRTLMSLNRSNGGLTYIEDGQIVAKWHNSSLPDSAELAEVLAADSQQLLGERLEEGKRRLQIFLFAVFALTLI